MIRVLVWTHVTATGKGSRAWTFMPSWIRSSRSSVSANASRIAPSSGTFSSTTTALEDLTVELIKGQRLAADEDGEVLVWTGASASAPAPAAPAPRPPRLHPRLSRGEDSDRPARALEGERKQVTVLFADLKGSTELIRRPRSRKTPSSLLDPALQRMMEAVHRYEGTVNQVHGRWHHGAVWGPAGP